MGLYSSNFRFDGLFPDVDVVRAEAKRRLGSLSGLEGLEVEGDVLNARSMFDPFTHVVLYAILEEMGGQRVSLADGKPIVVDVPDWARGCLSDLSWRERMAVRLGWHRRLFGSSAREDDTCL